MIPYNAAWHKRAILCQSFKKYICFKCKLIKTSGKSTWNGMHCQQVIASYKLLHTSQILWDVIAHPCPWYLQLAQHSWSRIWSVWYCTNIYQESLSIISWWIFIDRLPPRVLTTITCGPYWQKLQINYRQTIPQWPLLLTWFNFNPIMDK